MTPRHANDLQFVKVETKWFLPTGIARTEEQWRRLLQYGGRRARRAKRALALIEAELRYQREVVEAELRYRTEQEQG